MTIPRIPGLTVLNARSPSSEGLTCTQDTASSDKLKKVNNELAYYCCDISLTSASTLDFINKVIAGMQTSIKKLNVLTKSIKSI